jgi:hypothetical protein
MRPRQWVSQEAIAVEVDRYCRTRIIAALYWIPWPLFMTFISQFTTLGTLYPQTYDLFNPFILLYSTIGMFLWAGAFFLFISASQSGQLGGRLTGWWWQRRATPSQATG